MSLFKYCFSFGAAAFAILFSLLTSLQIHAETTACESVLSDSLVRLEGQKLNQAMAEKYPELAFVVGDPDNFLTEMQRRFQERKNANLKDPFAFDYSEVGLPLMKYAKEALHKKRPSLEEELAHIQKKIAHRQLPILKNWHSTHALEGRATELKIALQYYKDLQKESEVALERGSVSYKQTLEFTLYFSRLIGHFDTDKMDPLTRLYLNQIDRGLEGFKPLPIQAEYEIFKKREFFLFQMNSNQDGFTFAQGPMEKILYNSGELKGVIVPETIPIERDILYRMLMKNVSLVGLTADPILADGFLRPGGDFWNHDLRHESVKYFEQIKYANKVGLTEDQYSRLIQLQEKWYYEWTQALAAIKDPDLKEAVDLSAFNFFHDRGKPFTPITWLQRDDMKVYTGLLLMLKISGQGIGFHNVLLNYKKADAWLDSFWQARLSQEEDYLKSLGVEPPKAPAK
jgi:hypothetical protein